MESRMREIRTYVKTVPGVTIKRTASGLVIIFQ